MRTQSRFRRVLVMLLAQPLAVVMALMGVLIIFAVGFFGHLAVDAAVSAALFLPDQLGLVDHVLPDEIVKITGAGEHRVWLPQRGRYLAYSDEANGTNTMVVLTAVESGVQTEAVALLDDENQPITSVEDVPSFIFRVEEAGPYVVSVSSTADRFSLEIMPDVRNQNATVAVLGGIVQVVLLVMLLRLLYRTIYRERIRERARVRAEKADKFEAFLEEQRRKRP